MNQRVLMALILVAHLAGAVSAAAAGPAVLFSRGVHAGYAARPLHEQGLEIDVAAAGQLPAKLATGKYNVVVVSTMNDTDRKAVDDFLAAGGGVFVCNPENYWSDATWGPTNEWLAQRGARPRWELLEDTDPNNVVRDLMGCRLSYSTSVMPPVNQDVRGVLTLIWASTTGIEPPMSLDFSPDWTVVVRGAQSMQGKAEVRNDPPLQPWVPKELAAPAPPLMGVRQVGAGRLAVVGIRSHWLFTSPPNCPTVLAMLSQGAGDKPSDWLRVFANTFRWLAEPSLQAGRGGATTPPEVLNPPVQVWPKAPLLDWSKQAPLQDQLQTTGLIGARTALSSGTGTVAEYVQAAKAAGLQFLVFLEDSLKMDQARWDQLVEQCKAASDDTFLAVPGLTYEDAQGNHHYVFADDVKFPKPSMLLPDGRLATNQSYRTRAFFDYDNEYLQQKAIRGFWNHRANMLPPADYKLYNSFPVFSFEDGKPIDDALLDYLYLQGIGGCQNAVALEFMTSPAQVARRAAEGWRVVCHRPLKALNGAWHHGAWSFSGSGSQYLTNGPQILVWESPNRLCEPRGEWWRPDIWQYRLRLRVASDVGLKTVTIHDGDREVFRQWRPAGAKQFEQSLVLANCQQRGFTLVVEDLQGHRAISMSFWNRNLNNEEFFCSDRCNFLGNARLRKRSGEQYWTQVSFSANMGITPSKGRLNLQAAPATHLTANSPTLPVDGAPAGFPTYNLYLNPQIPGELPDLFAYPQTYLVGPEIGIGQADIKLGYDPAEKGAKETPFGFPYDQPQDGWGNSWSSWHKLVPTQKVAGWARLTACTWLTEGFRLGWLEMNLTAKDTIVVPDKGMQVTYFKGELWQGGQKIGTYDTPSLSGPFSKGTFATLQDKGGAVVLIGMGDDVVYQYAKGNLTLFHKPKQTQLAKGDPIRYTIAFAGASAETTTAEMVSFAEKFGVATPGQAAYTPRITRGKPLDNYLIWRLDGQGTGVTARIPKTQMPGFLPVCVEGLNDNWSVILLDKARPAPNTRALAIRDGRAWGQLDLNEADSDLFIGHPVVADRPQVKLLVSWQEPGVWFVEAHNPTEKPLPVNLNTAPGWTVFAFRESLTLPPGTSRIWTVREPVPPSSAGAVDR